MNPNHTCTCGRSPTEKCIGWHNLTEEEYKKKVSIYPRNMKLNEYIYEKIMNMFDPDTMSDYFSKDDIEKWIVDWYRSSFKKVGCDGEVDDTYEDTSRLPPTWLADWRKHIELD